jgi:hypothetical protein
LVTKSVNIFNNNNNKKKQIKKKQKNLPVAGNRNIPGENPRLLEER